MEFNSKLTKEICEVYGPTGRESKVAEYIASATSLRTRRETESALFCPHTWISSVL